MPLFAITIFLSAFLLFAVQPLLGRFLLPWFGGTPTVWTTCQLFFMVCLLGGYLYAHALPRLLRRRAQGWVHVGALLGSLVALPIIPSAELAQNQAADPTARILLVLALTVGLPYTALSTTGPLLQHWFAQRFPGRSPYRLYALSNVGSLLALLAYPLLFEPWLRLRPQAWAWSVGYVVFVACAVTVAWPRGGDEPDGSRVPFAPVTARGARPRVLTMLLWLLLAACGSWLMLATTNQVTQDVAVAPFLWVVPLALYLLTFILAFDRDRWYRRWLQGTLLAAGLGLGLWLLVQGVSAALWIQLLGYFAILFVGCWVAHGELYRLRPDPAYLTWFYLAVSLGGALAGVFIAIVAPRWFLGFWEYPLGLALVWFLLVAVMVGELGGRMFAETRVSRGSVGYALLITAAVVYGGYITGKLGEDALERSDGTLFQSRNFFGVVRVTEYSRDYDTWRWSLRHGRILHGYQYQRPSRRAWRTSYYGSTSGAGLALDGWPRQPRRVGVVGLGAGSLAAYAEPGDHFVFYDIDPTVIDLAETTFTYLDDARARGATVEVVAGDARLSLEAELRDAPRQFDLLLVDAFSGDAIPAHLLTLECARLYQAHLKPDGALLLHVSNRFVNLLPVSRALGEALGWPTVYVDNPTEEDRGISASDWVILTTNTWLLNDPALVAASELFAAEDRPLLWTDDYSNLLRLLRVRGW